jgi:hypothetical protein
VGSDVVDVDVVVSVGSDVVDVVVELVAVVSVGRVVVVASDDGGGCDGGRVVVDEAAAGFASGDRSSQFVGTAVEATTNNPMTP